MALPDNVDTCLVTGSFVYADGTVPAGTVEFTPHPCHILDADAIPPATIVAAPIVAVIGPTGEFAQDIPATDDADLNPADWTYHVRVRLNGGTGPGAVYSFDMAAPAGTVDLANVTPLTASDGTAIVVGPPGTPGPPGEGIAAGGDAGEVLAKASGDDYDTTWVSASAPGIHGDTHAAGSTDPVTLTQAQVTGLVGDLTAKATTVALTTHESDTTNVHGIADTSLVATTTAVALKADKATMITPTAPLTGGGDLSSNRTLAVSTFGTSSAGVVPASGGGTTAFLRADGTWAAPPGGGGGITGITVAAVGTPLDTDITTLDFLAGFTLTESPENEANIALVTFGTSVAGVVPASGGGTADFLRADGTWAQPPGIAGVSNTLTYSYNTATTEPPTGNQLRLNSTTFSAATRLWVTQTTVDGLDASVGLARILAGHQIYFQDRDDASHWVKYNVTADGVDDGTYYDFAVAYHSGPGAIAAGQVEFQLITPGTVGVPPGGTIGQVLAKDSASDYDVSWDTLTESDISGLTATLAAKAATVQTINAQTGTTYTLVLADAAKLVTLNNAAAVTLTVPTNASVAYPAGTHVDLAQLGVGLVTVAAAGGVTVNATPSLIFRARYSAATLIKLAADSWLMVGDLA